MAAESVDAFYFRDPSLHIQRNAQAAIGYLVGIVDGNETDDEVRFQAALAALDRAGFPASAPAC